jgi:hypothetical protein
MPERTPANKKSPESLAGTFIRSRSDNHGVTGTLSPEAPRADELSRAQPGVAERQLEAPREVKKRRTKMAVLGITSSAIEEGSAEYKRCLRNAGTYRKVRARELYAMHGYVSAGASSLLATESLQLACSRLLFEKASQESDTFKMAELLKSASNMANAARQNALSAYELSARESVQRKKTAAQEAALPWMEVQDGGKRKPGRPRKIDVMKEETEQNVAALNFVTSED